MVLPALQANNAEKFQALLGLAAHTALCHSVDAAVRHHSLLGLRYATALLCLLAGEGPQQARDDARAALAAAFPPERLQRLSPADLAAVHWEVAPPFKPAYQHR